MLVLSVISLMFIQALVGEFFGEAVLLARLWLLPVSALALNSKRLRMWPILFIGLMIDGLYQAPTGFHMTECILLYGLLVRFIEHLGHQTFLSRILLGTSVGIAHLVIHAALAYSFSFDAQAQYLLANIFSFLFIQVVLFSLLFPLFNALSYSRKGGQQRL